jgi:hypothetical protein
MLPVKWGRAVLMGVSLGILLARSGFLVGIATCFFVTYRHVHTG